MIDPIVDAGEDDEPDPEPMIDPEGDKMHQINCVKCGHVNIPAWFFVGDGDSRGYHCERCYTVVRQRMDRNGHMGCLPVLALLALFLMGCDPHHKIVPPMKPNLPSAPSFVAPAGESTLHNMPPLEDIDTEWEKLTPICLCCPCKCQDCQCENSSADVRAMPRAVTYARARVVKNHDGDTVTLQVNCRLAEIDSPELKQRWGPEARQKLADLLASKDVLFRVQAVDRYGRLVIELRDAQRRDDVNAIMVMSGAAWHYKEYSDSVVYADLERHAKEHDAGLWGDLTNPNPEAPWDYRRRIKAK